MVAELINMVKERINNGKVLCVSSECGASHIMTSIFPEEINTSNDDIYIEGKDFVFHVTNEQEYIVLYDEEENVFLIKQGEATYYLA